ncbi:MAG: hypothetical protein PHO08_02055 [Methylococcales bacterium]|nr:hypothetical protein [Methylococcales bacterium]MDD5630661.1 hypothetical protein [Methylococcales bacterium]
MKLRKLFVFALLAALAAPGFADRPKVESDGYDVMLDMILRPVGIAATLIGAGIFVGTSPLTGLASIPAPHDAFEKLGNTIICKPFKWTFMRPSGDYRYDEDCTHKVLPVVYQPAPPAVEQPKTGAAEPPVQYTDDTNKKIDALFKKEMTK